MLDNLMDFSPRDKNKLIFSSSSNAGAPWFFENIQMGTFLAKQDKRGKAKRERKRMETRQKSE